MKKLFLFFISSILLASCVGADKISKYKKTITINEIKDDKSMAKIGFELKPNFYTKENIIKLFGKPDEIKNDGDEEILSYSTTDAYTHTRIWLLLPFIKYKNDDNIYRYDFVLKNNQLEKIVYDDRKHSRYLLYPIAKKQVAFNPFRLAACDELSKDISVDFPHLNGMDVHISKNCSRLKLLDLSSLSMTGSEYRSKENSYTKVSGITIFRYNDNICNINKENNLKAIRELFLNSDKSRLDDTNITEEKTTINGMECKILNKIGKDYMANNKGHNKYLVFSASQATCFSNKYNMVVIVANSNRYSHDIIDDIDTKGELLEIIKSIKIKK